jgi:alginate O-acetyltransferase complex protein AlgI
VLFNTVSYVLFLVAALAIFWALPSHARKYFLLAASVIFYSLWRVEFLLIIFIATLIDFIVAIRLEHTDSPIRRRLLLMTSLSVNLGFLIYFKYLLFAAENVSALAAVFGFQLHLSKWQVILPLGISFYTFEAISYVVDVYRGHYPAHRNYLTYAAFILFFPKLIAGPIMRAREIIPQLEAQPRIDDDAVWFGLRRITLGLFLKICLADNISDLVSVGFQVRPALLSALDVWTLAFLFGFQIYFDFAAYSSIAIGSARLFGIVVPENFDFPYIASSPREFWRRWHISLSTWIRDYLYIPLQGERAERTAARSGIALFCTWFVMGLWHGANWTFVLWGLMHAAYIVAYRLSRRVFATVPDKVSQIVGWLFTLPAVMVAWVPFRAASVSDALTMLRAVLSPRAYLSLNLRENTYVITALLMLAFIATYTVSTSLAWTRERYPRAWLAGVFVASAILVPLVIAFLRPVNQFIYFQF